MSRTGAIAVRSVDVFTADLPLASPFRHASSGQIDVLEEVFVRVRTQDGVAGFGEVRGNAPYATGADRAAILSALLDRLVPALVAASPVTLAGAARLLDRITAPAVAKAAIDAALADALGRSLGVPCAALFGGAAPGSVKVHATIPFSSPEAAAARARDVAGLGIGLVKVRVGMPALEDDLARLAAVRAALRDLPGGQGVAVAADANQAWTAEAAQRALAAFKNFDLAFLEQPVAAADVEGLAALRRVAPCPIFADEAAATIADVLRLIAADACGGFHFKLAKAGGMAQLRALIEIAEAARKPCIVGQMDEGRLATAAALHVASGAAPLSCELWGFNRIARDISSGVEMRGGAVHFQGPGLGIDVDVRRLVPVTRPGRAA